MAIFTVFKPPGIDSALFLGRANCPPFSWGDDLEIVNMGLAIGRDGVSTVCSPWGVQSTVVLEEIRSVSSFTSGFFGS